MRRYQTVLSCLSAFVFVVGCGSSENAADSGLSAGEGEGSSECPDSSIDSPVENNEVFVCGDWEIGVGDLTVIPVDVVLDANSLNEIPAPGGSYVAIELSAKFNGEGTADLDDVYSVYGPGGIVGSSRVRYEIASVCCADSDGIVGQQWSRASAPFTGGTTTGYLLFEVGPDDGDFILGLDLDSYDEVKLWIKPAPAQGPIGGKDSTYNSLADLKLAFLQAGGECPDWYQSNIVELAQASGSCGEGEALLAIYASSAEIEENQAANKEFLRVLEDAGLDIADLLTPQLVGPNWSITSNEVSELQQVLGGVIAE